MAHAQTCPICNGQGKIKNPDHDKQATASPSMITCHGCGGRGWIEVADTYPPQGPWEIKWGKNKISIE